MILLGIIATSGASGGGGMVTPSLHWRIVVDANDGNGSFVGASEIELYQYSNDEQNVALGGTITVSEEDPSFLGVQTQKGFRGDSEDLIFWRTDGDPIVGSWIAWEFSQEVLVGRVMISSRQDPADHDQTIKDFTLQRSDDGIAWSDVESFVGTTYSGLDTHEYLTTYYDTGGEKLEVRGGGTTNIVLGKISDGITLRKGEVNIVLGKINDGLAVRQNTINIVLEP